MIDLRQVTYRYPGCQEPVLDALDLSVAAGQIVVVTGPSGSGKSSLLRTFNGLIPHFHGGTLAGHLRVAGLDPVALGPRGMSHEVGFVVQDPESHFVTRIVEDELAFAMENHAVAPKLMDERIERITEVLSIRHLRQRAVSSLSGGEKQRVAIASVLALEPSLLVLDEPTSQLDPIAAREVLDALQRLNQDHGTTLVLSEHRLHRVLPLARQLLLIDGPGRARLGDLRLLDGSPLAPPLLALAQHLGTSLSALRPEQAEQAEQSTGAMDLGALRQRLRGFEKTSPSPSQPSDDIAISVWGLRVKRPGSGSERPALDDLDLDFPRGQLTALLGPNGAGKSTLLESLIGLVRHQTGRIRLTVEGVELDPQRQSLRQLTQHVAFVPQNPSRLLFQPTVGAEVRFGLDRLPGGGATGDAVARHLARFGLQGLQEAYPRDLSSGERQRLALTLMTLQDPSVLLLDEPTRGLDEVAKGVLLTHLRRLIDGGVTVVLATHDVEMVAACADRVVMLDNGCVAAQGAPSDVFRRFPDWQPQMLELFGIPELLTFEAVAMALDKTEATNP